jgi:hypothetical protein
MTFQTIDLAVFVHRYHLRNEIFMTSQTLFPGNNPVELLDPDGIRKSAQSERHAVIPTVETLDQHLSKERLRSMAVIAGGNLTMASALPSLVLGTHDMTVGADFWIVLEIRKSLGEKKREPAQTSDTTGYQGDAQPEHEIAFQIPIHTHRSKPHLLQD